MTLKSCRPLRIQTLAVPVHHPQHWQQTRYLHAVRFGKGGGGGGGRWCQWGEGRVDTTKFDAVTLKSCRPLGIQTLAVPVHHPQHWQQTRYLHTVGQEDVQVEVPCQAGSTETDPVADQGHGAPGEGEGGVSGERGEVRKPGLKQ